MCGSCLAAAQRDPEGARTALLSWARIRGWPALSELAIEGGENAWRHGLARASPLALGLAWGEIEKRELEPQPNLTREQEESTVPVLKWTEPRVLDPGMYPAKVTEVSEVDGEYGPQIRIRFALLDWEGNETGDTINGYCSAVWGPRTKLYMWANAVLKGKISPGEDFDTDTLLNRRCDIQIEHRPGKAGVKAVVTHVFPYRTAAFPEEEPVDR